MGGTSGLLNNEMQNAPNFKFKSVLIITDFNRSINHNKLDLLIKFAVQINEQN